MADMLIDEQTIFEAARRIVSPASRQAYVDQACGDDAGLRARVLALLEAYAASESFLESPPPELYAYAADLTATTYREVNEAPGTVIGPYKLLQQIGEGGMGVVFMAEQTEPLQRTVALKIIKPGMDTRQVIARFEAERQAVAMMDHPNIAKVLDAGTTDSGRPYFVMELVKGVPITKYCDETHLPLRARLELFVQVCQAVQHAHQKGIIHRDIKPNNVLVAEYDHQTVPKVIDFGVAKATAQKLTERTMFTEFGQVLGTMEYMSPEQSKFNQLDIDTRSDIYSLGVLLYELLAGSTPFEAQRLHAAAFDEMLRIIREEEPQKPSTRLSSIDTLPSIAANRHTEPARLSKDVRGELDWIVMKALEKDRNRRYETASGFAADIERHLRDDPVEAGPPSTAYRLKKFVRRNKTGVLAGAAIVAALVVGLVVASIGFLEARRQAQIARAEVARGDRALAMMFNAEAKGNSQDAERLARKALATCKELYDEDHPEVCESLHVLAMVLSKRNPEEAISMARQSIAMRRKYSVDVTENEHARPRPDLAFSLDTLAGLLLRKGEVAEAENLYREALPMWRKFLGNDHIYVANTLEHLAECLSKQGKQAEAESYMRECFAIRRRLVGDKHPSTIKALNSLIELLKNEGKDEEAEDLSPEVADNRAALNSTDQTPKP
jgi:non-specific serine/threonine protein kinase/serine/threonine-protein kinase